jgi:hypothetical protein
METSIFDPAVYWTGLGLPIEMLKVVQGSGGKEAVCEYCGYKVELFGGYLQRHTDGSRHKMNVKAYKINTESKIQAFKTGYPLESVPKTNDDKSKKRERSPAPPPPPPPPGEEPKKKKLTMSEIIRAECSEQLNKVRDECMTRLKNAQVEYVAECEAELKKIDWKALITEEARNHVRNMVKDMFEKEASLE